MINSTLLERYRQDVSRCVRCGACSAVCPSFLADRRESRSPRGRIALIGAVLDGALSSSELYKDRLATCAGCLACQARCPAGVPVPDIIQAAREQAVRDSGTGVIASLIATALKHEGVLKSLAWLAPAALHYAGKTMRGRERHAGGSARHAVRQAGGAGRGERVALFPGCAISHFQQDIGRALRAVLDRMGYDVVVPAGLQCCGRPFLSLGDRASALERARHNAAALARAGASAIVTACASCSLTFKKEYPPLLANSGVKPPRVLDIHEFLAAGLPAANLGERRMTITWHDPCHLARGQGLGTTARELLRALPGVTLVEMNNPDRCCGFGGIMRATHAALSIDIGEAKARDIIATGASLVATGCPGCRMQIDDALARLGADIPVVHTVQLLEIVLEAGCRTTGVVTEAAVT